MSWRILVTGANGDIGEAIGRILRETWPEATVDGADCAGRWPGGFTFSAMHPLPLAADESYPAALVDLGAGYDLVIPSSEPELLRLATDPGGAKDLPLLMVRPDLLTCFLDKMDTAGWLGEHDLNPPWTMPLAEANASLLPLLAKPRRGAGGRGQEIVRTPARLALAQAEHPDGMVAQELLDVRDQEYTCALYAHDGDIRTLALRRWLVGGHTGKAEVVDDARITRLLEAIARASGLDGCINVQLRLVDGRPRVFEINPRLSSTVMMRHRLGFCDLVWWVEARLAERVSPVRAMPRAGTMVYRVSDERVVEAP